MSLPPMYSGSDPNETVAPPTHESEVGHFDAGLGERFPMWTGWDVVRIVAICLGSMMFFGMLAMMIGSSLPAFRTVSPKAIATDPRLVVPAQMLAYVVTFIFLYRLLSRHYGAPFGEAIHWKWPKMTWPLYIASGVAIAVGIQMLSMHLPIPKQMPIDEFFRTRSGAWLLAIFGTMLAPVFEELFFRALLFPTLVQKSNMTVGVLVTSGAFALIHAGQLGRAWAPVFVLFLVGLALTLVRAASRSVAASVLVHVGYNATLFAMLYAATDGFTRMNNVLK